MWVVLYRMMDLKFSILNKCCEDREYGDGCYWNVCD